LPAAAAYPHVTQTPSNAANMRDNQDFTGILIGLP